MTPFINKAGSAIAVEGPTTLVLSRKLHETIMIGDEVEIMVVDIRDDKVRLSITAPGRCRCILARPSAATQEEGRGKTGVLSKGRVGFWRNVTERQREERHEVILTQTRCGGHRGTFGI